MTEKAMERKVKGTLLVPLAMLIRAQKQVDWLSQTELTAQELKKIQEGILPSLWYPLDFYERLARATAKVIAKNDPKLIYEFGRTLMVDILLKIYPAQLFPTNPESILEKALSLVNNILFNSVKAELKTLEQGWLFRVSDPAGIPVQEMFVPTMKGIIMGMIQKYQLGKFRVECAEESLLSSKKLDSVSFQIFKEG